MSGAGKISAWKKCDLNFSVFASPKCFFPMLGRNWCWFVCRTQTLFSCKSDPSFGQEETEQLTKLVVQIVKLKYKQKWFSKKKRHARLTLVWTSLKTKGCHDSVPVVGALSRASFKICPAETKTLSWYLSSQCESITSAGVDNPPTCGRIFYTLIFVSIL